MIYKVDNSHNKIILEIVAFMDGILVGTIGVWSIGMCVYEKTPETTGASGAKSY